MAQWRAREWRAIKKQLKHKSIFSLIPIVYIWNDISNCARRIWYQPATSARHFLRFGFGGVFVFASIISAFLWYKKWFSIGQENITWADAKVGMWEYFSWPETRNLPKKHANALTAVNTSAFRTAISGSRTALCVRFATLNCCGDTFLNR